MPSDYTVRLLKQMAKGVLADISSPFGADTWSVFALTDTSTSFNAWTSNDFKTHSALFNATDTSANFTFAIQACIY